MPKDIYVVQDPNTGLYLIAYSIISPEQSTFGNLENAIEYDTLEAANNAATAIDSGTVGVRKP